MAETSMTEHERERFKFYKELLGHGSGLTLDEERDFNHLTELARQEIQDELKCSDQCVHEGRYIQ